MMSYNVLKNNWEKKHIATPRLLTEEDPIAAHLSNPSELDEPPSDHESNYKENEQNIEKIKTKAGQLVIAKQGLVKKERKVKKITCPVCDDVIYTQRCMNVHMTELHPKFNFQCSLCQALFKSYNAAYHHTQTHFQLRYVCDICSHRSQYPGGAQVHMKTHTRSKLIPYTWWGCKKEFTSKKLVWQHLQAHGSDIWKCNKCNKMFDTFSYFCQHKKGIHFTSWRALCGAFCQWPHIRAKHQRNCTKCQEIKLDCQNKPINLHKFTCRNLNQLKQTDDEIGNDNENNEQEQSAMEEKDTKETDNVQNDRDNAQ